ncbi:hypothetical protein CDAR_192221 [Caerostris darwini]|uniref:Uncharacterized protein n=1 Tax=Caerostris darwini TaxID=1538125 RepID=A0AAV4M516_9ARAC|nr:hypothetical protein CDAR_192221 [Caerostris darwini]
MPSAGPSMSSPPSRISSLFLFLPSKYLRTLSFHETDSESILNCPRVFVSSRFASFRIGFVCKASASALNLTLLFSVHVLNLDDTNQTEDKRIFISILDSNTALGTESLHVTIFAFELFVAKDYF